MRVNRKDQHLNEIIELLDLHYERAGHNTAKAYASLGKLELQFVESEIERCTDFRYYSENYHCIQSESEGIHTLYPWWDSQEIFYNVIIGLQSTGKRVKIICLKARQLGISTAASAITFHKTVFTPACNSVVVAQDADQADYLFEMSRRSYELLPWWMKPEAKYEAKGRYLVFDRKDDEQQLSDPGLKSQILVAASNKAHGVGVGKTFRSAHLTELSLWRDADVLSRHLFPTMNAPDTLAIMESTARGRNNTWHTLWVNAEKGKIDWTPVFIEYIRAEKYSLPIPKEMDFTLTTEEEGIRKHFLENKQFEVTNEAFYWRRKKIEEFVATEGEEWGFFGEYPVFPEEAFQGSGICAFDKRRLHKLMNTTCHPPLWYGEISLKGGEAMIPTVSLKEVKPNEVLPPQEKRGSRLHIWEQPQDGEVYYIAADIGYGSEGGDFTCAQVMRLGKTKEPDVQVAEWRGWIYPHPFAEVLFALGMWYNKAQIAIECNGPGLDTNNNLYQNLLYDNIFRWKHYDKIKNRLTDYFGWWTNVKTRDGIITRMAQAIDDGSVIIRSMGLVDEMFDFAAEEVGARFEGQVANDDRVFAWMICFFCAHDSDQAQLASTAPREDEQEKKKKDFQNTAFSPVYDQKGTQRNRLFKEKGIPAEVLALGDGYAEHNQTAEEEQWKLW